jgi:hypothetical protein
MPRGDAKPYLHGTGAPVGWRQASARPRLQRLMEPPEDSIAEGGCRLRLGRWSATGWRWKKEGGICPSQRRPEGSPRSISRCVLMGWGYTDIEGRGRGRSTPSDGRRLGCFEFIKRGEGWWVGRVTVGGSLEFWASPGVEIHTTRAQYVVFFLWACGARGNKADSCSQIARLDSLPAT